MAISFGATSENLLRGIDRLIATVATALPAGRNRSAPRVSRAWAAERGNEIVRAKVDVSGGFPGSLRWQQQLVNISLYLTDSWLIIGEGTNTGFALPISHLAGASVQGFGGLQPPSLVVWFQDGDRKGSFLLTFRGTARNRVGELRAQWLFDHLAQLGVPGVDEHTARFTPSIYCAWDNLDDIADDEVLLSGNAIASSAGPFGANLDSVDFWLTERMLIWCPQHGDGLNCLPLTDIVDCRNGFGDRLAIGIEDACGGRYDLYFDFSSRQERNNPAAQVQHILEAAGIPLGTVAAPVAPWRRGGTRRPSDI